MNPLKLPLRSEHCFHESPKKPKGALFSLASGTSGFMLPCAPSDLKLVSLTRGTVAVGIRLKKKERVLLNPAFIYSTYRARQGRDRPYTVVGQLTGV